MFRDLKELKEYVEDVCVSVIAEPEQCYICGKYLTNNVGFANYYLCDEFAPDEKFCSKECIEELLINKIGIEEDDK